MISIVNVPFIYSNIPADLQLIRYSRACGSYKFFSFRVRCFNWYVNDRFNNFNIGEDQGNYPTDTIVCFGCIEYRPPNKQCFGTDMRCYIYVLLKFTVPTKCWLLEQVTSAQTQRAAEHIPMLWIRVTS